MHCTKRYSVNIIASGLAFAVLASATPHAADAADLGTPSIKDAYAEPPEEPRYYNWSGLYGGGYIGGAHGLWTIDFFRNNNHGHAEEGLDGIAGGGWVGYNVMLRNNWVVGIEGELGGTTAEQSNDIFDNDKSLARYGLYGSLRARAGYAFNRLLVYGTAGAAFADIDENIQKGQNAGEQVVWENHTPIGFAVGGGVEYAFTNNWIGRAEYLYSDFGSKDLVNADGNRAVFGNELHLARVGMSYKF